jgi:hypothetical protein
VGESRVMSHRKTNATAPVLDSTLLFARRAKGKRKLVQWGCYANYPLRGLANSSLFIDLPQF